MATNSSPRERTPALPRSLAFILLLLFGTQILSWQVALAIPLAAAAFGVYRVKRHMPSPYAVAQLIDQRLELADNLSTAIFFSEVNPDAPVAPDIRRAQFEHADALAAVRGCAPRRTVCDAARASMRWPP